MFAPLLKTLLQFESCSRVTHFFVLLMQPGYDFFEIQKNTFLYNNLRYFLLFYALKISFVFALI